LKALFGVASVALAIVVAGCGGGSSDETAPDSKPSEESSAQARKLIKEAFGANPKASSGTLSGTIDINVKGVPRFRKPIQISTSGPFGQSGGSAPKANLSVGIALRDGSLGGELILVDDQALIGLGSTAYAVPDSIASTLRRPLSRRDNALSAVLKVFGIAPERWAKNPRIVGNERVAGIDTIHGEAEIDTGLFFLDAAKLTKTLTALRITEITGLPRVIDRKARRALERSVTKSTGDVYIGADDKVMRKAGFEIRMKMSKADRKTLGGISSLNLVGTLDVTDVGSDPAIDVPRNRGSYDALQLALDALAEAVQ